MFLCLRLNLMFRNNLYNINYNLPSIYDKKTTHIVVCTTGYAVLGTTYTGPSTFMTVLISNGRLFFSSPNHQIGCAFRG